MTTTPYTVVLHKNSSQKNFGIYIGEDIPNGIYIVTLEPNSPAAHSNIQPGDRVLAVNGQLLSQISTNPKEFVLHIANTTESLTLSLESSDLLKFVDYPSINNNISSNKPYRYVSEQSNGIDPNLENYIKSLFGDENLHLLTSGSSNRNEYVLTSDYHSSRPHRHHRKRKSRNGINTQPPPPPSQVQQPIIDGQKDNNSSLLRQRSIPNMGTSQVLLRNSQQNPKDNEIHEFPELKTLPNITPGLTNTNFNKNNSVLPNNTFGPVLSPQESYDYSPQPPSLSNNTPQQSFKNPPSSPSPSPNKPSVGIQNLQTPLAGLRPSLSSSNNNDGFRLLRLHRIPDFNGFGFHLQYNKLYYSVQQIEPNSPSERGGLHPGDVIVRVNDQPTANMSHKTFVQIVNASTDLILSVQSYEDYERANPDALRPPPYREPINANTNNNRKIDDKPRNVFSKALTKLKSR